MIDIASGNIMFDLPKNRSSSIKVIGVGGGGSNAVNYMFQQGITGVDFVICNTDAQALNNSSVPNKIQLGQSITEGMGAGANPEVGEQAALESMDDIKAMLDSSTKMVFITAGMGGGTGTGAAPIIAGLAKELGILTVGIVTAPFYFEGKMRLGQAEKGIEKLRKNVDSLIVINNDKLREQYGNLGYKDGFAKADEVLTTAAKGIAEVITHHYATNIDLRDAKTVLANSGTAIMGSGRASGDNKAKEAISAALDSPLLNNNKITGAQNVLLLIVSGEIEITMDEIGVINDYIQNEAGHNANIIMGIGEDLELGDKISVTVVATGFPADDQVFTGREEEKVFHRLEEEQPLVQKLSVETPNPVKLAIKSQELTQVKEGQEIRFNLDDELEENWEPRLKTEKINKQPNLFSEEEHQNLTDNPIEELEEEHTETIIFSLEDEKQEGKEEDLVLEEPKPKNIIIDEDLTDVPISQSIAQTIEERSARLKQFNFKFKSTLNKSIDEIESIPAYQRKGVQLNEREEAKPSSLKLSKDTNNEIKIRPNNFLHDNVD